MKTQTTKFYFNSRAYLIKLSAVRNKISFAKARLSQIHQICETIFLVYLKLGVKKASTPKQ